MKSTLVMKLSFCLGLCLGVLVTATGLNAQTQSDSKEQVENSVSVTIDKNTSDTDFENIKTMLAEYDIEAEFTNIERNASDEIIGIAIKLSSNNSQTSSSFSGNRPIQPMSFGSKNGKLYIGRGGANGNTFLFSNGANAFNFPFDTDSIFGQRLGAFNFDDFFNSNSNLFMFNGDSLDFDSLRKQFFDKFSGGSKQKSNSYNFPNGKESDYYQYNFVDDPNKDTLIIIDGEVSNFETLDTLAKANKLKSVDTLQPATAMSIYGNKGKDGAIIATTK